MGQSHLVMNEPREQGVNFRDRLLALACYFGLAPFVWYFQSVYRKNRFLNHHLFDSLAYYFLIICMILLQLTAEVLLYRKLVADPSVASGTDSAVNGYRILPNLLSVVLLIIGTVLNLAWCVSVLGAILGHMWHLPIISRVASTKSATVFAVHVTLLFYLVCIMGFGVGLHSMRLARSQPRPADVYILYTTSGYAPALGLYDSFTPPKWAVTMAFYPMVLAGMDKFGESGVSVLPLTEESLNEAIQNGRFIFIASHGGASPGKLAISTSPLREYGPFEISSGLVGSKLQFVYFAGCEAGSLRSEWLNALHLKDAIMFDRISYVGEHLAWIWFKSPAAIAGLK